MFDLVITDYQMPKMTGTDLCRHLRQDDRYYRTPIIFMTAMSRDLDIPKLQDELGRSLAGLNGFAKKVLHAERSSRLPILGQSSPAEFPTTARPPTALPRHFPTERNRDYLAMRTLPFPTFEHGVRSIRRFVPNLASYSVDKRSVKLMHLGVVS